MKYANVSVKFPQDLDREIERFLEETGVYTNKSEFIKEAVRHHLIDLNNQPAVTALRVEQLLARIEAEPVSDTELQARLDELRRRVDDETVTDAVESAREEMADEYADHA